MGRGWWKTFQEGEVSIFRRKVYDHYLSGCASVIYIDYPEESRTITREYSAAFLELLNQEIKETLHLAKKIVLFDQGNATTQKGAIAMAKSFEIATNCFAVHHVPLIRFLRTSSFSIFERVDHM